MVHNFVLDPAADGHPLYVVLGKVFSWLPGEVALNLNFMSAFFAAWAVTILFLIVEELTGQKVAAAIAAMAFALSHAFWLHAVITEVYTLNCFFVGLLVLLLLRWRRAPEDVRWLYAAAFVFGLAISHHLIIGLCGVGGLVYIALVERRVLLSPRRLGVMLGLFALGSAVYWGVLLHWYLTLPGKAAEIADIVTGRQHKQYMLSAITERLGDLVKNIGLYVGYLVYQFPAVGGVLGVFGGYHLWQKQRQEAVLLFLLIGVNAGFFLVGASLWYSSNYTFFIQDYFLFAVCLGYGVHVIYERFSPRFARKPEWYFSTLLLLSVALPPLVMYQLTPVLVKRLGIELIHARPLPYRDKDWFFLWPSKAGYHGAERYAKEAFSVAEPKALIIADYTPAVVLDYYQQVLGMRPDVELVYLQDAIAGVPDNDLKPYVDRRYGERPIYLGDLVRSYYYYNVTELEKEYVIEPVKPIYKVIKRK